MTSKFNMPVQIEYSSLSGLVLRLREEISEKRVVLVASEGTISRLRLNGFLKDLENKNGLLWINRVLPNPTESLLGQALGEMKGEAEILIAIGGGSTIDLAKGIYAFYEQRKNQTVIKNLKESIKNSGYVGKINGSLPFIAVPTTAGTGSEVTRFATIWSSDGLEKLSIESALLCPHLVFLIPEALKLLPKRILLSSAFDALAHATESYWSNHSNTLSREIALTAVRLIIENLPLLLEDQTQAGPAEKQLTASLLAGIAIDNTKTTACHSISYPLTMKFHIEHGFAAALTLTSVMRRNRERIKEFGRLMDAYQCEDIDAVDSWIQQQSQGIQLMRLAAFGVRKEQIDEVVRMANTKARMNNNPVIFTEEEVREILYDVF